MKGIQHHLILIIGLILWGFLPVTISNAVFYLAVVIVSVCIGRAGYEQAKLRRTAWLRQYLKDSSTLNDSLAVGFLSMVIIIPVAAFWAVVLLLNLRAGGWAIWVPVLAGFLIFLSSKRVLLPKVSEHVVQSSVAPVVRKLSIFPTALTMIIVSVAISLFALHPNVEGLGWLETMERGTAEVQGAGILAFMERLYTGISLTEYWAIQNTIKSLSTPVLLNVMGWMLFFLSKCAFVWAFCRLLVGLESLSQYFSQVKHG